MKLIKEELEKYISEHPEATQKEMGRYFNVSVSGISRALTRYDINWDNKKRKPKVEISKEELEEYIKEHPDEYLWQISKKLGLNESKIKRYIARYGIDWRDPKKSDGRAKTTTKEKILSKIIELLVSNPQYTIEDVEYFLRNKKNIQIPVKILLREEMKRKNIQGKEKEAKLIENLLNRGQSIEER